MPGLTFPPIDLRPGARPPTCPDCGASWRRGDLHACQPPEPAGWWARLRHRLRLWCSPPVATFVVFDDEVNRSPPPRPPRHVLVVVVKDP